MTIEIAPQDGPQSEFAATPADIAIYGGAAGGGKSYALLIEPLRHHLNPKFGGVIFRRNSVQVRNEGGLWDESSNIYPLFDARPKEATLEWNFPSGMRMKFAHLEYDSTVLDWQGSQIPFIGFDELTHFTEKQFFYMLSRNRSTSGVPGYVRATTNPDADSWVRHFIDWWIGADGLPIKERSGVLRWFIRREDQIVWADTPDEIFDEFGRGPEIQPKSVTFISALVQDNKILMEKDPSYLGNLLALPKVERLRLLGGNWNIRPAAGMYFQREWFQIVDDANVGAIQTIRYWDRAATRPNETNKDPDYTAGLRLTKLSSGGFLVEHVARLRDRPLAVERAVKNIATQDGYSVSIGIEQDPGSAGVADADNYARLLAGYDIRIRKPTTDKVTRALPVSAQCERGNILLLRGEWNEEFLTELENFDGSDSGHDDQVDAFSGAFNEICGNISMWDV